MTEEACEDCAELEPGQKCYCCREFDEDHNDPDWTGFCIRCGTEHELWSKRMCPGKEADA